MTVAIYNRQKDLKINKSSARVLVLSVLSFLKIPFDEVTLYFVGEERISAMHAEFFQDPTPTDCISFPIDESHLGEIFVCPAAAVRYAAKKKGDPYSETALYMIHGLLHLIGYGDLEPEEKREMRKKEKSCMRHLDRLKITLK
ncbi:MAG: rRNA maturation RNase YbeY [Chlamydiales bacterium]